MTSTADLPAWLTLKDAARCVDLSKRTLKRRIDDGELSGEKRLVGQQEQWMVQTAELKRWAEVEGQALNVPQDLRQAPAESAAETPAPEATADKLRQDLAATEAELAATKARLEAVEAERDRVWAHLQELTPMLPAARQEVDEARQRAAEEARQRAAMAAEADKLRQELRQERQRSWLDRLLGRTGSE